MEEIKEYIKCLDNIEDYLDDLDETAGIPFEVADALITLQSFFNELYILNHKK